MTMPVNAVSDDGYLFFAQGNAHIYRAANLVIDEIGEDAAMYAATGPICSMGRVMFWEPRCGDVSRQ